MTAYLKITREHWELMKRGGNLTLNVKPGTTKILIRIAQELRTENFLDEFLSMFAKGAKR